MKTKGYIPALFAIFGFFLLSGMLGLAIWKSFQIGRIWRGPGIDPALCISLEDSPVDFTVMMAGIVIGFLTFFSCACLLTWEFIRGLTRKQQQSAAASPDPKAGDAQP